MSFFNETAASKNSLHSLIVIACSAFNALQFRPPFEQVIGQPPDRFGAESLISIFADDSQVKARRTTALYVIQLKNPEESDPICICSGNPEGLAIGRIEISLVRESTHLSC